MAGFDPGPAAAFAGVGRRLAAVTRWLGTHSIRVGVYAVFTLLLLLVIGLGMFGVTRLSEVNQVSEVIRNHWLRDIRILGDLSNYMSDYRTAEATRLLSATPLESAASERELANLQATVHESQVAYQEIVQNPAEAALYADFAAQWAGYQRVAARGIALARTGEAAQAVASYKTESRLAFDRSSDRLSQLTDQTLAEARHDSDSAALIYAHARNMIVAAMLLAMALVLGMIIYLTRGILAPLLKLVACMHELAAQGLQVVVPSLQRRDEIGEMARAVSVFRDNAVALVASRRRFIEQAAALEAGLEHEKRLAAQQRDFISMTSHEFRTPLTIIDGHAQRLIKTSSRLDAGDINERGARIRNAVQRITNIMGQPAGFVANPRWQRGVRVPRRRSGGPVAGGVPGEPRRHPERPDRRGACVAAGGQSVAMRVCCFMRSATLISNAIKYSPAGSLIEVTARGEADWWVVEIRDCGIGIPERDREHLFERYFRGSNATTVAGTGVGLHLVSMVVSLHRGAVFVESLEGIGSLFIVRLPVLGATAAADAEPA